MAKHPDSKRLHTKQEKKEHKRFRDERKRRRVEQK